jgi:hypothetical protein
MAVCFQPMSYTELSTDEEQLGLMVLLKCQFGDLFFYAPVPRTMFETGFWGLSLILKAYSLNKVAAWTDPLSWSIS